MNRPPLKPPFLSELLMEAGIAIFVIGFCLGYSLKIEKKYEFKSEVLSSIEDNLLIPEVDIIQQASWETVEKAEEKLFVEKPTEESIFFAPIFAQPFLTSRGWMQRTTCLSSPKFSRPIPTRLTSRYGHRKSPFTGYTRVHSGLDYGGKIGTPIQAAETGFVHWARRRGGYGKTVMVTHRNGFTSLYAHMSKYAVKEGDRVQKGQTLGYVGKTGRSTGPHLHFEVRCNNIPINPTAYFKRKGRKAVVSKIFRYKPEWKRPRATKRVVESEPIKMRRPAKSAQKPTIFSKKRPRTL